MQMPAAKSWWYNWFEIRLSLVSSDPTSISIRGDPFTKSKKNDRLTDNFQTRQHSAAHGKTLPPRLRFSLPLGR